ncbi:MAG TPA: sugar ABC transporter permease, partial [Mesotoga infera]|nr:sugar ABC transporter permease [Mesotoga infera]
MSGAGNLKRRIAVTALIFIAPVLIYNIIFKIVPIFVSFFLSLTKFSGFGEARFIGLANYARIFGDSEFWRAVLVT